MLRSYIKQVVTTTWTPKTVDLLLTTIPGNDKSMTALCNMKIYAKCKFTYQQYLFIYRLILSKTIEILDCILKDNQNAFIKPHQDIHIAYPLFLFALKEIGFIRKKFLIQILDRDITFDEIPNLAGDPNTMINNWINNRANYLNFQGEVENLFSINGRQEFPIPTRIEFILEETDKALEKQRSQYSPIKVNGIQLKNGTLSYKDKKIKFTKNTTRLNLLKLIYKNPTGISSTDIREKLEMSYDLFKTNIKQLKDKIKCIKLTIRYDKDKKVYLLTTL